MSCGLFITGTGTGVGKTYVGALVVKALRDAGKRVGVYKPVASGCDTRYGKLVSPDAVKLWEAAGRPGSLQQVCPQLFAAPLAPHLAAQAVGQLVDPILLREGIEFWRETSDVVIVEGAGGLMSPISEEDYNADLAAVFGVPLLVVAANALGTINATLQTLIAAKTGTCYFSVDESLPAARPGKNVECPLFVAGVVLNSPNQMGDDPSVESNAGELARRCGSPFLATVEYGRGSIGRWIGGNCVRLPDRAAR